MRGALFDQVWLNGKLDQHLEAVYGSGFPLGPAAEIPEQPSLTYTKLELARAAGRISRASGRGGGTAEPGRMLLRVAPSALATLASRLKHGVVLVTGTNGKTTTARMLAGILAADGHAVVHNREGANTHWGIATALAERSGDIGVFEVDEAWLPLLCAQLRPRVVVLCNLFRDRLDSYGELQRLVTLWRSLLAGPGAPAAVVANADDPLLSGPRGVLAGVTDEPLLFGIDDERVGAAHPAHPHDAHSCGGCGERLEYDRAFVGHLGHWSCAGCKWSRPSPVVRAVSVWGTGLEPASAAIEFGIRSADVRLRFPGVHNVYNALAASTAAVHLGASLDSVRAGLESTEPPFGRSEEIAIDGQRVQLMLVKNPVGMNATLSMLGAEARSSERSLHLWLALNDNHPDGRDVSWIWDANFEQLAWAVAAATCSGTRASELALRLKCAGWESPRVDPDLDSSLQTALDLAPGQLFALPTYTALLGLRPVLNRRGVSVTDWGWTACGFS